MFDPIKYRYSSASLDEELAKIDRISRELVEMTERMNRDWRETFDEAHRRLGEVSHESH